MGFIEKIEDKKIQLLIKETESYIDELIIYGEYIIKEINDNIEPQSDRYHEKTVLLLGTECLRILDGIRALIKDSSIDISFVLIRTLLELTVYIMYILNDKKYIEKRAIAYDINNIRRKIKVYEELYISTSDRKYLDAKDNLNNIFKNYNIYRQVDADWKKEENNVKVKGKKKNKKKNVKWHSVYGGGNSFKTLCDTLNISDIYSAYGHFSNIIHAGDAENGIYVNDKGIVFFKNPKIPFHAQEVIEATYSLVTNVYSLLIKYFMYDDDINNYVVWENRIKERKVILENKWNVYRDTYIKDGNLYS